MKKAKIISLLMALTTLFSVSAPIYAVEAYDYSTSLISEDDIMLISPNPAENTDSISVLLNGETVDFTDDKGNKVDPQLVNNRTMVPVRKIFEVLGATISWDEPTQTVTATTEEKTMKLQINNNVATVTEGEKTEELKLDAAPVIIDGRTLVPVRFISETLGLKVGWDQETQTVIIMDTHIILEIIEKEAPTFYALLMEEATPIKTGEVGLTMTGTLKYTNEEEKTNNSNLKLTSNGLMKITEKALGLDFDYKITGKGVVYDDMKSEGLDSMSMSAVVDMENPATYIKSSLLKSTIGNKWIKETYQNPEEILDLSALQNEDKSAEEKLQELIDGMFDMVDITLSTYDNTKMLTRIACKFVSDEFMTVSGRTTKTYKYVITAEDVERIITNMGIELPLNEVFKNTKLQFSVKYANGVSTEATYNLTSQIIMDYEKVDLAFDLKAISKNINGNVNVKIPADKDVMTMEELEAEIQE